MFEEFVKKVSIEISRELPGFSAQKLMAPLGRQPFSEYITREPKKSAVLILLYPQQEPFEIKTVFIQRPDNEGGSHAGQVSFPGGGMDGSDKDLSETALREAEEEIGVDRQSVSLLGALTPLYIPVSNYMVHPFVGAVANAPSFNIQPAEVKGLLEVRVNDLVSGIYTRTTERFIRIRNTKMEVPCYDISGEIIWGATAMIVSEFSEIMRRIK